MDAGSKTRVPSAKRGPLSRTAFRAATLGIVAATVVGLQGQGAAPSSQAPTFRGGVAVVQLDVSVTDRAGRPVRDLRAADFSVVEQGDTRPVVSFERIDLPPMSATAPKAAAVASDVTSNQHDAQRLVVIVMDDANTGLSGGGSRSIEAIS